MKKYKTGSYYTLIEEVEAISETKCFICIRYDWGMRREAKHTQWDNYFDTWDKAKQFLLEKAEAKVNAHRAQLGEAERQVATIKGLKPPEKSQ